MLERTEEDCPNPGMGRVVLGARAAATRHAGCLSFPGRASLPDVAAAGLLARVSAKTAD